MTETSNALPPQRRHPRIPLAAAAGAALVVGLVGYALGHARGSDGAATPAASTSTCTRAHDALARQNATASASPGNAGVLRTTANLMVENRECFDPQVVAAAQAYLDKLSQDG